MVIMTCCILVGLVLLWWKSGRVTETIEQWNANAGRGQVRSRRPYEDDDHEARKGRALQK